MKFNTGLLTCLLLCSSSAFPTDPALKTNPKAEGLHLDWLDTSVQPGMDFYSFANGGWQKKNPIPPEYAAWGNFNVVNNKVLELIHQMLIKASENKNAKPGSIEQKVGDFYYSGMDEQAIDRLGITPLKPEFDRINAVKNLKEFQNELIHLHQIGVDAIFAFGSMQDYKNSKEMIGALVQGGLSLPDRDYYLKDDPKFKKIREAFVLHMGKMLKLLGDSPDQAVKEAQIIMDIETQLATVSMPLIAQRDPKAVYHITALKDLDTTLPNFAISHYLSDAGQGQLKSVNLAMPDFFKAVNSLLTKISLDNWKIYLRWHLLDAYSAYLSKPFVDENFKMTRVLTGAEKLLPRWKRVVNTENGALGFAIGKMYVDKHFSVSSKEQVLDILNNIRTVLKNDISTLSWMTPETRKEALQKLNMMEERVGYPSKWWDYSRLKVDRGPYVLNVIRANEFLVKRDIDKIGKPIDRSEWGMTPQTINAYYDPSMNNINMPAGILQAPFFDPKAPAAVNYGSIGFVMGHEITHGFDDQGAQFDGHGNLKNWWTSSDLTQFNNATQCIADQFSGYAVDGSHVQGKLVVGEATADLGGIILAYRAFLHSNAYKNAETIDGFTPEQQFFLGVGHSWATNIRPEQMRNQLTTDPHPPAKYRVNGSLANIPEFQAAFKLPDNSLMVNKKRCVIW